MDRDPTELYQLHDDPRLAEPVLLCILDGFIDAGGVGALIKDQLFRGLEHHLVASFDVDRLIDYRSRRPPMTFIEDHWDSYEAHELSIRRFRDTKGEPFLLLSGPEPDHEWERFTAAIRGLIERWRVRLTAGITGIPMTVPHTRPIRMTAHGTRPELAAGYSRWLTRVQVPGSAAALLEFRLGEAGYDAVGFAVHVPNYLSQAAYPAAAIAGLDALTKATGLAFPDEELHRAAEQTDAEIARQVAESDEIADVVRTLEERYDLYAETDQPASGLSTDLPDMPTAEELGAQFERFLAEQERRDDGPDD